MLRRRFVQWDINVLVFIAGRRRIHFMLLVHVLSRSVLTRRKRKKYKTRNMYYLLSYRNALKCYYNSFRNNLLVLWCFHYFQRLLVTFSALVNRYERVLLDFFPKKRKSNTKSTKVKNQTEISKSLNKMSHRINAQKMKKMTKRRISSGQRRSFN